jgi:hypothetical protein
MYIYIYLCMNKFACKDVIYLIIFFFYLYLGEVLLEFIDDRTFCSWNVADKKTCWASIIQKDSSTIIGLRLFFYCSLYLFRINT